MATVQLFDIRFQPHSLIERLQRMRVKLDMASNANHAGIPQQQHLAKLQVLSSYIANNIDAIATSYGV